MKKSYTLLTICVVIGLASILYINAIEADNVKADESTILKDVSSIASQQANGSSASLFNIQDDPNMTEVDACIQLPSAADWVPQARLIVGEEIYEAQGWGIIDWRKIDFSDPSRCYRFEFDVALGKANSVNARLEVQRVMTSLPEQITRAACDKAHQKLEKLEPRIQFECRENGFTHDYEITQKPDELTDVQAYELLYEAFAEVVEGPWSFPVELSPQE